MIDQVVKPVDVPALFIVSGIWLFALGHPVAGSIQLVLFLMAVLA